MARYPLAEDGEWFAPKRKGFRWQCCDCSLIHIVHFRVVDGRIEMKVDRCERATAAARRNKKKKVLVVE